MVDSMVCASCGRSKQYPDGFAVRHFAECWECAWDGHVHASHPRLVRKVKRAVKKRAKAQATRDLMAVAMASEKRQMLGVHFATPPAAHSTRGERVVTDESDAPCRPYRVYDRGEAWVQRDCGEAVTCGDGREFVGGDSSHRHSDDCLPLVCPGVAFPPGQTTATRGDDR